MTTDPLETVGEIYTAFAYSSPEAARVAWQTAMPLAKHVSLWRGSLKDPPVDQICVVCGERAQHKTIHRVKIVLRRTAIGEIDLPDYALESFRNRRRKLFIESALSGEEAPRRELHFGEQGAYGYSDGSVRLKRRQG